MKKKILGVALVVCILVLSIASVTMAYFTDEKSATNVFTVGNVEIKLTESNGTEIVFDSSSDDDNLKDAVTFPNLFPAINVDKIPVITNTGTENAYIGAIITIDNVGSNVGDITKLLALPTATIAANDNTTVKVNEFIMGLSTDATLYYEAVTEGGTVTQYKIYMIFDQYTSTDGAYKLFSGVYMNPAWDNAEMAQCKGLNITVNAYATQVPGFANATEAITTAFAEEFAFVVAP